MKLPYLVGKRIYLRPLDVPDAELCVRWMTGAETRHFIVGGRRPLSVSQEIDWIKRTGTQSNQVQLVIVRTEGDLPLGVTGLREIDLIDRDASFGIVLGEPAARSQGLGTEATELLLDYSFDTLNLHRVHLEVLADNARAIRCYEKAGFVTEGRLREATFTEGAYRDVLAMGILASEHRARRVARVP